jgi:hypothetical protein
MFTNDSSRCETTRYKQRLLRKNPNAYPPIKPRRQASPTKFKDQRLQHYKRPHGKARPSQKPSRKVAAQPADPVHEQGAAHRHVSVECERLGAAGPPPWPRLRQPLGARRDARGQRQCRQPLLARWRRRRTAADAPDGTGQRRHRRQRRRRRRAPRLGPTLGLLQVLDVVPPLLVLLLSRGVVVVMRGGGGFAGRGAQGPGLTLAEADGCTGARRLLLPLVARGVVQDGRVRVARGRVV